MKARIVSNLLEVIDEYFEGKEGHRDDPKFLALCDRISGRIVDIKFVHGDAFESIDDNYWLPPCCYKPILWRIK